MQYCLNSGTRFLSKKLKLLNFLMDSVLMSIIDSPLPSRCLEGTNRNCMLSEVYVCDHITFYININFSLKLLTKPAGTNKLQAKLSLISFFFKKFVSYKVSSKHVLHMKYCKYDVADPSQRELYSAVYSSHW